MVLCIKNVISDRLRIPWALECPLSDLIANIIIYKFNLRIVTVIPDLVLWCNRSWWPHASGIWLIFCNWSWSMIASTTIADCKSIATVSLLNICYYNTTAYLFSRPVFTWLDQSYAGVLFLNEKHVHKYVVFTSAMIEYWPTKQKEIDQKIRKKNQTENRDLDLRSVPPGWGWKRGHLQKSADMMTIIELFLPNWNKIASKRWEKGIRTLKGAVSDGVTGGEAKGTNPETG